MVSIPTWEAGSDAIPAIVQPANVPTSSLSPAPPSAQPDADQLEAARLRVQQHLQQIVESSRVQSAPNVSPAPTPQPMPAPVLRGSAPSDGASPQTPSLQTLQKLKKPDPAAAVSPAPANPTEAARSLTPSPSIPFVPETVAVAPMPLGAFCTATSSPQPSPAALFSIARISTGVANFLQVSPPPQFKPQGQPVDLRTLGGTPAVNCDTATLSFPLARPAPITSGFGWRIHPVMGTPRFHAGIDFGADYGTLVQAADAGTVVESGDAGDGYGGKVVIESQSQRTLYAHLSSVAVRPGQRVVRGQPIGRVGSTGLSTGPHLHFETQVLTRTGWQAVNPIGER